MVITELKVNPEFEKLIPPLTKEEYEQLEKNVTAEGIRDALVTWRGTLIDGHNRYRIAENYNLPYSVVEKHFENEDDVRQWIISNQLGRRNISDFVKYELHKAWRKIEEEKRRQNLKTNIGNGQRVSTIDTGKTRDKLAEKLKWSSGKVAMADIVDEKSDEQTKEKLRKNELTINQVYEDIKKEEKKEKLKQKKESYFERIETDKGNDNKINIFNTDKKFRIIYADPAWNYNDKCEGGGVQTGGVEIRHYNTISTKDICALPVKNIIEKDAILFLWVTSPLLPDGLEVIKSWGFEYKTSFIWDKVRHNMGHYNSVRHEFLLVAAKGSCTPDNKTLYDSVQSIEKTDKHSQKPVEFLNIIDDLYNWGDRIELFCRENNNKNWMIWGNEI